MTKDTPDRDERAEPQKGRRRPLTIDLPAEEVARKVSDTAEPDNAGQPAPVSDTTETPPSVGAAEPTESQSDLRANASEPTPADPPRERHEDVQPGAGASIMFVPLLVAAIIGGALVAVIVVLLARGGFFLPTNSREAELAADVSALKSEIAALKQAEATDDVAPLREEIAALGKQVSEFASAPATAPDAAAVTELQGRVSKLADDVAALKSTAPADSAAAQSAVADLSKQVEQLAAQFAAAPTKDSLAALQTKLDAADQKIDDAAALAPAVAADALAAALDAGRSFAAELAALKTLGVDPKAIDVLAAHAESGLATLARLRAEFETQIASVDLAAPVPDGTGMIDRLLQGARGLVSVRPAHPTAGTDPAAVVTRIRGALEAGDLKAALAEWNALPDDIKKATADWARDAEARRAADDLVAALRGAALSRLKAGR